MTYQTRFYLGVAVSALMAGPALADVTPEEVWQSWVDYSASMGQPLTEGERQRDGDRLVVSDVTSSNAFEGGEVTAEVTLPQITLRDMGDGRVEVTTSDSYQLTTSMKDGESKVQEVSGTITQSGMQVVVSGTPDNMAYDVVAKSFVYDLAISPDADTAMPMQVRVSADGIVGAYAMQQEGSGFATSGNIKADSATLTMSGEEKGEAAGKMDLNWTIAPVEVTHNSIMPAGLNMSDLGAALKAGATMQADIKMGPGKYDMAVVSDTEDNMTATGTDEGGRLAVAIADGAVSYDAESNGIKGSIAAGNLPFPIEFSAEKVGTKVLIPAVKSETPVPYKMVVDLKALSLSDMIWSMLDPSQQLPRDPISLLVDLDGTTTMPVDLFDPKSVEEMDDDANPFAGGDLNINTVALNAVGASVTATGKLKLPAESTDPEAEEAMPVGTISARGSGINPLLDKLVAMGMIPEDEMMGMRMMLALFTQADGDDSLTSEIEFREDGGIYANGQRIQ